MRLYTARAEENSIIRAVCLGLSVAVYLCAGVPDWVAGAAKQGGAAADKDASAVILLDEQAVRVRGNAEISIRCRRVIRVLGPEGQKHNLLKVNFDRETRLTTLKAWGIAPDGTEYEVHEKDAIESQIWPGVLYQDMRHKTLVIPGAQPGGVIAYEYEQQERPQILQKFWDFQQEFPVRKAIFDLELPDGWNVETKWRNYTAKEPERTQGNRWMWRLEAIPALAEEPLMPHPTAVTARMGLVFVPPQNQRQKPISGRVHSTWQDVGLWYRNLTVGRLQPTAEVQKVAAKISGDSTTSLNKIAALAVYVQRRVRYVAIAIGIGGYQPHQAGEILQNSYGDCKDKVTLLGALLASIGIESYYVLVHTDRGAIDPEIPTALSFNHAILAIRLPDETGGNLPAAQPHPRWSRLLFFDPTDTMTSFGNLPENLQGSQGLLITDDGGELLKLPSPAPALNRFMRTAKMALDAEGNLKGEIQEMSWATQASSRRSELLQLPNAERAKVIDRIVGNSIGCYTLHDARLQDLMASDKPFGIAYSFTACEYTKAAGNLVLLRPRVIGLGDRLAELKDEKRRHPLSFDAVHLDSEVEEIRLPDQFDVDEIPPATEIQTAFASYRSRTELVGQILKHTVVYELKDISVPAEQIDEVKKFYRRIAADERNIVVLRRRVQ